MPGHVGDIRREARNKEWSILIVVSLDASRDASTAGRIRGALPVHGRTFLHGKGFSPGRPGSHLQRASVPGNRQPGLLASYIRPGTFTRPANQTEQMGSGIDSNHFAIVLIRAPASTRPGGRAVDRVTPSTLPSRLRRGFMVRGARDARRRPDTPAKCLQSASC
jgi:hypothetical protein